MLLLLQLAILLLLPLLLLLVTQALLLLLPLLLETVQLLLRLPLPLVTAGTEAHLLLLLLLLLPVQQQLPPLLLPQVLLSCRNAICTAESLRSALNAVPNNLCCVNSS